MTEPTTIIPTIPKRTSTRIQKDKTQEGGGKRLKLKDVCDESGDQNANDKAGSGAGDGEKEEEVVVEKVIEGVDPRMRREKVMLEDNEDEEDEESEEEEVDESPSDSSVPERVCTQPRSARDMMDGFMDHDDDNENETPTELGNVLRESDNRQDGNRMVDGVGMTGALNKALSHRAAGHCREKHMTDRIVDYCKTQLFRKVKFITGEEMTTKAVVTVMDALKIQAHERPDFVKLYTTCVTGSINTKRSTCEQAGSKIVRDLLIKKNTNRMMEYHHTAWKVLSNFEEATRVRLKTWKPFCGSSGLSWIVYLELEHGEASENMWRKFPRLRLKVLEER